MPKKTQYAIRVFLPAKGFNATNTTVSTLIECLRYAGLVSNRIEENDDGLNFIIHRPHGLESNIWANQNIARMASFQIRAAKLQVDRI